MPTTIRTTKQFDRAVKRLTRKFPGITSVLKQLATAIAADDRPGDRIPNVGHDVYKVRLPNPSAGRGKSGGFRVIYYVRVRDVVYLLKIYSKFEQADIPLVEIQKVISEISSDSEVDKSPEDGAGEDK